MADTIPFKSTLLHKSLTLTQTTAIRYTQTTAIG